MTLEQYVTQQTPFWRRQNIEKARIASVSTWEQAEWLDECGNQEIFNNNIQRS